MFPCTKTKKKEKRAELILNHRIRTILRRVQEKMTRNEKRMKKFTVQFFGNQMAAQK